METTDEEIIEIAKNNYLIAKEKYINTINVGPRWEGYNVEFDQKFNNYKNLEQILYDACQWGKFEIRLKGKNNLRYVEKTHNQIIKKYPKYKNFMYSFEETPLLNFTETNQVFQGRIVSSTLYDHIKHILKILEYCLPNSILEIGAGFGASLRLWFKNHYFNPKFIYNVDLIESLFYAEVFLRKTCPDLNIIYFNNKNDLKFKEKGNIILCPTSNIDTITDQMQIDLICNYGSMGEMSNEYINHYLKQIEKSSAKYFYSDNRYAEPLDYTSETMNYGINYLSKSWNLIDFNYYLSSIYFTQQEVSSAKEISKILINKTSNKISERGSLEMFFKKENFDIDLTNYDKIVDELTIKASKTARINVSDIVKLLDAERKCSDSQKVINIYKIIVNKFYFIPKELLNHFKKSLKKDNSSYENVDLYLYYLKKYYESRMKYLIQYVKDCWFINNKKTALDQIKIMEAHLHKECLNFLPYIVVKSLIVIDKKKVSEYLSCINNLRPFKSKQNNLKKLMSKKAYSLEDIATLIFEYFLIYMNNSKSKDLIHIKEKFKLELFSHTFK